MLFQRSRPVSEKPAAPDADLHDAFSNAVIGAVERAGPSVIGVRRGKRSADVFDGAGSGVLVTTDGFALTNNHVVRGADRIEASLHDGRIDEPGRVSCGRAILIERKTVEGLSQPRRRQMDR
jgi:S1-C subfamily serine protease